jgi:hypothetical protein
MGAVGLSSILSEGASMITHRHGMVGFCMPLALIALTACSDSPRHDLTAPLGSVSSRAATTTTTNEFITPFEFDTEGECPGMETVRFSGTLHAVAHTTITSTGGIHSFVQFGPVGGVLGFGLTSGGQYAVPGMLHDTYNVNGTGASATETFVNNFQMLGQGNLPDRNFHETFHITVNANGEVTVVFDNATEVCR